MLASVFYMKSQIWAHASFWFLAFLLLRIRPLTMLLQWGIASGVIVFTPHAMDCDGIIRKALLERDFVSGNRKSSDLLYRLDSSLRNASCISEILQFLLA
jgi:hypothetical protein